MPFRASGLRRLDLRIVVLLSVALLPVGLIAVYQSRAVSAAAAEQSRLSLQLLTAQAAAREWRLLEGAYGASRSLAAAVPLFKDDSRLCARIFGAYLQRPDAGPLSFAGFVPPSGMVTCSSTGRTHDLSGLPGFAAWMEAERGGMVFAPDAPISGEPVIIVSHPVRFAGGFMGYVSISVPHRALAPGPATVAAPRDLELITVNARGQVLTASMGMEGVLDRLPVELDLGEFASGPAAAFSAIDGTGERRNYAIVPIVSGSVYALGRWARGPMPAMRAWTTWFAALAPLAMWVASLGVAYVAIHRLVIRHIRSVQSKMRAFALYRRLPRSEPDDEMPAELADMQRTFTRMTEIVLRDEAELENSVHERNVLLKEVHHRVKNNLQLISSMMNIQMRKVTQPETRIVLRRLQDRILGLASIHRSLYQAPQLSQLRVDVLIGDILAQMVASSPHASDDLDCRKDLDPVVLYPDQAVPLSLLAGEAITNALKHLEATPDGRKMVSVTLRAESGRARFVVENSRGPDMPPDEAEAAGIGTKLIGAFAQQLGARPEISDDAETYRIEIAFEVIGFEPAGEDETLDAFVTVGQSALRSTG